MANTSAGAACRANEALGAVGELGEGENTLPYSGGNLSNNGRFMDVSVPSRGDDAAAESIHLG
jgi:hypothetical protein